MRLYYRIKNLKASFTASAVGKIPQRYRQSPLFFELANNLRQSDSV
jgi:hypothetical protein